MQQDAAGSWGSKSFSLQRYPPDQGVQLRWFRRWSWRDPQRLNRWRVKLRCEPLTALLPALQVKCSYTPDQYSPNAKPNNGPAVAWVLDF